MDIFRLVAHIFAYGRQKRYDVMVDFPVNFMNAFHIEVGFFLDDFHRFLGNPSQFGIGLTSGNFHVQHGLPFISFFPNFPHFTSGVSRNH